MRLTDLRLWPVEVTCRDVPATFGTSRRRHVLVSLTSADGVTGWGEMTGLSAKTPLAPDLPRLEVALRRELVGADARDPRSVNERLRHWLGDDGTARQVRCGLDLALIDLRGRARGEPAWRVLGGASRDRLRVAYAIGAHRHVDEVPASIAHVGERLARGFDLIRFYIGLNQAADDLFLQRLRERYGQRVTIKTLDCNTHLDARAALRAIERYRAYGFLLVESPARRGDIEGLAHVRRHGPAPVSEHVYSPGEALALARAEAVDVFNLRCISLGGVSVALEVAAIARAAGIGCVLGAAHELNLGTAAQVHLGAILPTHDYPADCIGPEIYDDDVTDGRLHYAGSTVHVPDGPGLGFTVSDEHLARLQVPDA